MAHGCRSSSTRHRWRLTIRDRLTALLDAHRADPALAVELSGLAPGTTDEPPLEPRAGRHEPVHRQGGRRINAGALPDALAVTQDGDYLEVGGLRVILV